MKKIGPLSTDLVVACAIHDLKKSKKEGWVSDISQMLRKVMTPQELKENLDELIYLGIIWTEHRTLDSGRAGRVYFITKEARKMIKETHDLFWDKVVICLE